MQTHARLKLTMQKQAEAGALLALLPRELRDKHIYPHLPLHAVAALEQTSNAINQELLATYWKNKVRDLPNCNDEMMLWLEHGVKIKNWRKLYHGVITFDRYLVDTPWMYLCLSGDIDAIRFGLQHNLIRDWKHNPLHLVAINGSIEMLKLLVTRLNLVPSSSLIHMAAQGGNRLLLSELKSYFKTQYSPFNINEKNKNGLTPLLSAAHQGSCLGMAACKALGAALDASDIGGNNALHYAAAGGSVKAMQYAVEMLHISQYSKNNSQYSAFLMAAKFGRARAMRFAMNRLQNNTKALTSDGSNAFHLAVKASCLEGIRIAAECQLNVNLRNTLSFTPLHTALMYICGPLLAQMIKLLRQLGANVELKLARHLDSTPYYVMGSLVIHEEVLKHLTEPLEAASSVPSLTPKFG